MEPYTAPGDSRESSFCPEKRKNRGSFLVLKDTQIEARRQPDGGREDTIFLSGRLSEQIRLTYPDFEFPELLETCEGFRKVVHSVGVCIMAGEQSLNTEQIRFVFQLYGKQDRYGTGTQLSVNCPCNGEEQLLVLRTQSWDPEDAEPGAFHFHFPALPALDTAFVTIRFYLYDGYEVEDAAEADAVDLASEGYRRMIERSVVCTGSDGRLKAVLERAAQKEPITVAFIGGSITQGAGAKPLSTKCYAYQTAERLKQRTGNPDIRLIKAGVGGTPSELGVVRFERDVLRDGAVRPDLIIIEFAVNDEGDETRGRCFESLVRMALTAPGKPAVVLLFAVFMSDWNLEERLLPIGEYYGLPMVSVRSAVTGQFRERENRVLSKQQFFYDIYHPSNLGHQIMADCLEELMKRVMEAPAVPIAELQKPSLLSDAFAKLKLLDRSHRNPAAEILPGGFTDTDPALQCVELDADRQPTPQFPDNWMSRGKGDPFTLTLTCRSLILVFKDSGDPAFGKAEIRVDHILKYIADPHRNNWDHCNPVVLVEEEKSAEHQVEIRMCPGEEEKAFTILGFGYA